MRLTDSIVYCVPQRGKPLILDKLVDTDKQARTIATGLLGQRFEPVLWQSCHSNGPVCSAERLSS